MYQQLMCNDFDLADAVKKYTLLDAIKNIQEAWNSLTESCIVNCWKHTQIASIYDETVDVFEDDHNYSNNDSL